MLGKLSHLRKTWYEQSLNIFALKCLLILTKPTALKELLWITINLWSGACTGTNVTLAKYVIDFSTVCSIPFNRTCLVSPKEEVEEAHHCDHSFIEITCCSCIAYYSIYCTWSVFAPRPINYFESTNYDNVRTNININQYQYYNRWVRSEIKLPWRLRRASKVNCQKGF